MSGREESLRQIERIAASDVLRGSESLCKLLRYLGRQTLDNPDAPIREYQIATQVFSRPMEFDPRLDSTVRVQTGRLRAKLAEYYRSAGGADAIVVEIPKGTYQLAFHVKPSAESAAGAPASQPVANTSSTAPARRRSAWMFAFAGMTAVALTLALVVVFRPARSPGSPGASLERFWQGLLENPSRPLVVFRTGTEETLAVHELDGLFAALGHGVPIKPVGLLSPADLRSSDVIFVGPPPDNAGLPRPGGSPPTEDYAVISLQSGATSGRWLLTLAGTTGIGTQAAVHFVCRDDAVRSLLEKTGGSPFEALVHTRIRDGAPADTQIVAVHKANR